MKKGGWSGGAYATGPKYGFGTYSHQCVMVGHPTNVISFSRGGGGVRVESDAVTLLRHALASRSAKPTRGMVARSSALSSASCARFRSAVERITSASSSSPIAALAASSRDRSLAAHSSASDASGTCSQPEA